MDKYLNKLNNEYEQKFNDNFVLNKHPNWRVVIKFTKILDEKEIDPLGLLFIMDENNALVAIFDITDYDCTRSALDKVDVTPKSTFKIEDSVVKKAYIATMTKLFPEYKEDYLQNQNTTVNPLD